MAQGDGATARELCQQILKEFPEDPGARHLLGLLEYQSGNPLAAEDHLRHAAESAKTTALYVLSYAELCCKGRDRAAALAMTRRALTLDARLPLAWLALGSQLLEAAEYPEAKDCLEQAFRLDPGLWQAQCQLATLLAATGNIAEADRLFEQLLRDKSGEAEVLAQHAAYLQYLGRHTEALLQIERAIEKSPSLDHHLRAADIDAHCGRFQAALDRLESMQHVGSNDPKWLAPKATLLRLLDRFEEAIPLCRDALAAGVQSGDLLRAHAQALHLAGEDEEAFAALDRAAALRPALALSDKAVLLSTLGRFAEACSTFDRALHHDPALVDAWYDKANAKTFTRRDPDIGAMGALLDSGRSYRDRMLLHFALGKAHFETDSTDIAFTHWHEGNRMNRALIDYDSDRAGEGLRSIAAMPLDLPDGRPAGSRASDCPVFVVGMPRCGSSLIEQMLSSHPDVHGGGEQMRLRGLFDPFLQLLDRRDEDRAAEAALRILRRRSGQAKAVIDKDLMNFKYLGVIHRIFPRARIIHCRRSALDTCFSAYTKLFVGNFPFTYDLRELGLYYRSYHSLMEHWRSTLPRANFMDVDYEALVSQPRETIRQLLDFLALPWHENCVRFSETRRPINTASLLQARQPIYRSSVGRSAALRVHLLPLSDALGDLANPG